MMKLMMNTTSPSGSHRPACGLRIDGVHKARAGSADNAQNHQGHHQHDVDLGLGRSHEGVDLHFDLHLVGDDLLGLPNDFVGPAGLALNSGIDGGKAGYILQAAAPAKSENASDSGTALWNLLMMRSSSTMMSPLLGVNQGQILPGALRI